eukprot:10663416-Alexandrium_andersonii.AAC.1
MGRARVAPRTPELGSAPRRRWARDAQHCAGFGGARPHLSAQPEASPVSPHLTNMDGRFVDEERVAGVEVEEDG